MSVVGLPLFSKIVFGAGILFASSMNGVLAKIEAKGVSDYPLECGITFSCPASLTPRVNFWVEVFSRWDTSTAVLHDKNNPHRVFATVTRKNGCRRSKKGDAIYNERRKIKGLLKAAATNLEKGKELTLLQSHLVYSFHDLPASQRPKAIRSAANNLRCQSGNRDRMENALKQYGVHKPSILDALEAQNISQDLLYLPFVESAFNPKALSHVGAAGMWQIMPRTGKKLGLRITNSVDERYDPKRATVAAAKYLRNATDTLAEQAIASGHQISESNLLPFVITSYNYGVQGMRRAIRQVGLDYERLLSEYKSPNFQTAVKNFYASFLAARHVAKNQEKFFPGLQPEYAQAIHSFNTVALQRATSVKRLSSGLNVSRDDLKALNPSIKRLAWKDKVLLPRGFKLNLPYREQGWAYRMSQINKLPKEVEKPGFVYHRVRRGQTACGIAERYRASCSQLIRLNGLNKRATIYVGQRLKVPSRTGGISIVGSSVSKGTGSRLTSDTTAQGVYRVNRGDSACLIAERHSMRCSEFLALNGLSKRSVLQIGQKVRVLDVSGWHLVRSGQTACSIARKYSVSCQSLLRANNLSATSVIRTGQRLVIPQRG